MTIFEIILLYLIVTSITMFVFVKKDGKPNSFGEFVTDFLVCATLVGLGILIIILIGSILYILYLTLASINWYNFFHLKMW